jgi:drug/metabolite transporter (DMT)-like permease
MKYLLASLSVLSAVFAQILIKKASFYQFAERKWFVFILFSIFFYAVTFLTQTFVIRFFPISKILPVSAIAIMILIFLAGILFFGESVNMKQIAGIVLGIISILLILS